MASSVGSLVVSLGLNSAEFTQGLTKAEYQAQRFAQNTRAAILEVAKVIGALEIGRQVFESTKAIISEAAALNDLSDATGSSVESLSRLNNQAKIAGTDFATLQNAVLKLSQGMAGTDEEATKTKEALKLLGITTRDPVQALQEAAVKLNTYADGVNKVGLAVALFGKQGGQFTATLKDIAELQDVGATVSAKQAAEAENLEKAFRRLSVEATTFRNVILSDVVPALTSMITEITESTRVAGGLFNAFRLFSGLDLSDPSAKIRELNANIAELEKQKTPDGIFSRINNALVQQHIDDARKQIELLRLTQQRREAALGGPGDPGGVFAGKKPDAPFISGIKDAKALKEKTSETERYLQSLEKQLQGTLDLNAEETILVELYRLQHDAQSGLTESSEALIRDYARQVQAAADVKKATEEQKRAEEEASRIRHRISLDNTREIEQAQHTAQAMRDQNEALREHLAFLQGGEEGLRKYIDLKDADALASLKQAEATALNAGADARYIDAIRDQIKALKEKQTLLLDTRAAEQLKKEMQVLEDFKGSIGDLGVNSFEGFIKGTKSAKDAFKSFIDDIESMLIRLALKKLMNQILGVNETGPDIFSVFAKLLGSFGGGGGAAISATSGGAGIELGSLASGTNYWRGGLTMVGENGPELAYLPRGSAVKNSADTRAMMGGVSIGDMQMHFHIAGQVNSASIRQIRNAARDGVMAAVSDH